MIVSFSLMRRRADISVEEFREHWLDPHGPLTAKIPGTRRYVQNHVVEGPGTNAAARALDLDGFAELAFASSESRAAAHSSPEIQLCNQDSRLFIGAVSRVITDEGDAQPPPGQAAIKQFYMTTRQPHRQTAQQELSGLLNRLDIVAVVPQRVLEQAGPSHSTVSSHGIEVETLHLVWVASEESMVRNAAILAQAAPNIAVFQVRTYDFI